MWVDREGKLLVLILAVIGNVVVLGLVHLLVFAPPLLAFLFSLLFLQLSLLGLFLGFDLLLL